MSVLELTTDDASVLGDRLRVGRAALQQTAAHLVTAHTVLSVTNITSCVMESSVIVII